MFDTLAGGGDNSQRVCGIRDSMTAIHWLFISNSLLNSNCVVKKTGEKKDPGFPPIAWFASPVCAEPNGLWDWWSGNEHTCWNQPAIHRSPTIKAIQFLFWSGAWQVLKTVCLCMLSYCRLYICLCVRCVWPHMCTTPHKNMSGLVRAVHGHTGSVRLSSPHTPPGCPRVLMVSCWLLGILWLALHTGWWGVTANLVTQTGAAQLIGHGWPPQTILLGCVYDIYMRITYHTMHDRCLFDWRLCPQSERQFAASLLSVHTVARRSFQKHVGIRSENTDMGHFLRQLHSMCCVFWLFHWIIFDISFGVISSKDNMKWLSVQF